MIWTNASAIMGTVHDEVIRPNMVSMGGAKPHTGTIVQPKTGPAIAATPILAGQVGDRFAQRIFVIALHRHTTLCRSGLPQYNDRLDAPTRSVLAERVEPLVCVVRGLVVSPQGFLNTRQSRRNCGHTVLGNRASSKQCVDGVSSSIQSSQCYN